MAIIETAETDIKERLSVGVVTLVAARAGCEVNETKVDRVSKDVTITPIAGDGAGVSIDAQLKATVNLIDAGEHYKFDLDVKKYNDLRKKDVGNARILVVLKLHDSADNWLKISPNDIVLNHCAYWLSLYAAPPTQNGTKIRVSIPKVQVFSPDGLTDIISRRYLRILAHHGGL